MDFLACTRTVFNSSVNDASSMSPSSSSNRRTGTRSIAIYSIFLSLVVLFRSTLKHPSYSEVVNEVPPELAGLLPMEVTVDRKTELRNKRDPNITIADKHLSQNGDNVSRTARNSSLSIDDHAIMRIARGNNTDMPVVPVVVWPLVERGPKNAVSKHFEENGVNESIYLEVSNNMWNFDPKVVWVGNIAFGPKNWCNKFHSRITEAKEKRAKLGLPLQWPIFIIDWGDHGKKLQCQNIEKEMGPGFVKYSQRSVVHGRKWKASEGWVTFGSRRDDSNHATHRHMPYFVRTDTIEALDSALKEKYNATLESPIETLERKIQVATFWPRKMKGVRNIHCKLRKEVSRIVEETGKNASLVTFVDLAGKAVKKGRRGVHSAYVETMLDSEIVVVTQRDSWEDHYRLMEALTSGAMVMTDRMLSLPRGLENGTSVVEFGSAEDLRAKILYYTSHPKERLEIAREGRRISMNQHRSWHRVEEVIFGRPVSDCSNAKKWNPCPYIVHAKESIQ